MSIYNSNEYDIYLLRVIHAVSSKQDIAVQLRFNV